MKGFLIILLLGINLFGNKFPIQKNLTAEEMVSFKLKDHFTITKRATYDITARVLSKKNYITDQWAPIAPVDLFLGWNEMSIEKNIYKIERRQSNRFTYWNVRYSIIPIKTIEMESANTHIIPANDEVFFRVKDLKKDQFVRMKGFLVDIKNESNNYYWNTSLIRGDMGDGGCEIFYVEEIEVIN